MGKKSMTDSTIDITYHPNAIVVKTLNCRSILSHHPLDKEHCVLSLKQFIGYDYKDKNGIPKAVTQELKKGVLTADMGMTPNRIKILQFLLTEYLEEMGIEPINKNNLERQ